jgi:MFS family permease
MKPADGGYLALLRRPGVAAMLGSSTLAQLQMGMVPVALVLFGYSATGSFASAGAIVGAYAAGGAVGGPLFARMIDTRGLRRVVAGTAVAHVALLVALVALAASVSPLLAAAIAALAGATMPPVLAVRRELWGQLVHEDSMRRAYSVDALSMEAIFIGGPLLAGIVTGVWSADAAVLTGGALTAIGVAGFLATGLERTAAPPDARHSRIMGALSVPGIRTVTVATFGVGICFGGLEVTVPAFAEQQGDGSLAGLLLAIQGVGSTVGGLAYGARGGRRGDVFAYLTFGALVPVTFGLLGVAPSLIAMALLMPLTGVAVAPLSAARMQVISRNAPARHRTEAFMWSLTSTNLGQAVGSGLAGALTAPHGWRVALLAVVALGALGPLAAIPLRRTLAPA